MARVKTPPQEPRHPERHLTDPAQPRTHGQPTEPSHPTDPAQPRTHGQPRALSHLTDLARPSGRRRRRRSHVRTSNHGSRPGDPARPMAHEHPEHRGHPRGDRHPRRPEHLRERGCRAGRGRLGGRKLPGAPRPCAHPRTLLACRDGPARFRRGCPPTSAGRANHQARPGRNARGAPARRGWARSP